MSVATPAVGVNGIRCVAGPPPTIVVELLGLWITHSAVPLVSV